MRKKNIIGQCIGCKKNIPKSARHLTNKGTGAMMCVPCWEKKTGMKLDTPKVKR